MEIQTIELAGFASALNALRLPFGKQLRSNVGMDISRDVIDYAYVDGVSHPLFAPLKVTQTIDIHPLDMQLMTTLVKRGDEHAKVIRGIIAYAKITAPVYWWCELETYRAGHERLSSESTMHIDCKGLAGEELVAAKASIPMGKELTKVDMFSYQALRNIVRQRHNHRLPEWHTFVDWVRALPYADELILAGLDIDQPKQSDRWRADEGGVYYTLYKGKVMKTTDRRKAFDNRAYESGEYYRTKEEAKAKEVKE